MKGRAGDIDRIRFVREFEMSRKLIEISKERLLRSTERLAITYNYVYLFFAHSILGAFLAGLALAGHAAIAVLAGAHPGLEEAIKSVVARLVVTDSAVHPPEIMGKAQVVSMVATLLGIVIGVFGVISQLFSFEYGSETVMKRPLSVMPAPPGRGRGRRAEGADEGRAGGDAPWFRWTRRVEVYFPRPGAYELFSAEKGLAGLLILSLIILLAPLFIERWSNLFEILLLLLSLAVASATIALAWLTTMIRPPLVAFLHSIGYAGPEITAYSEHPGEEDLFYSPYYMLSRGKLSRIARAYAHVSLFTLSMAAWLILIGSAIAYSAPTFFSAQPSHLSIAVEFTLGVIAASFSLSILGVPRLQRLARRLGIWRALASALAVIAVSAIALKLQGGLALKWLLVIGAFALAPFWATIIFALSYEVAGSTPLGFRVLSRYMARLLTTRTSPSKLASRDVDYEIVAAALSLAYIASMSGVYVYNRKGLLIISNDAVEEFLSITPMLTELVVEYLKTQHVIGSTILLSGTVTLKCLERSLLSETPLYATAVFNILGALLYFRLFASTSVDAQLVSAIDEAAASMIAIAPEVARKYPTITCRAKFNLTPETHVINPLEREILIEHVTKLTQGSKCRERNLTL